MASLHRLLGTSRGLLFFDNIGHSEKSMPKPKQPPSASDTLEEPLDRVSNAREELVAIERNLERLKGDIAKLQKQKDGSGKKR
jgi:hypothetical protein